MSSASNDIGIGGNTYPNPSNYPLVSFPQPVTPPDGEADEPDTNMIVEYNPVWTPVLMAACDQLLLPSSWAGNHDEIIQALNRAQELKWMLQNPSVVGERDYPTPYWDDETSVDDEMPPEEQDWYGIVEDVDAAPDELTFVENAVIWLLTGFVAVAASPTLVGSIGAAIFFRTAAVRFTLAFNRGDIREVFRVVIDAIDYGEVDTDGLAEGDIVELDVNGLADSPTHDILIVRKTP